MGCRVRGHGVLIVVTVIHVAVLARFRAPRRSLSAGLRWRAIAGAVKPRARDGHPAAIRGRFFPTRYYKRTRNAARFLRRGFSSPEPWGVWTDGPFVELLYPIDRPIGGDVEFIVAVHAYSSEAYPRDRRAAIRVNGEVVGEWRFEHPPRAAEKAIRDLADRARPAAGSAKIGDRVSLSLIRGD